MKVIRITAFFTLCVFLAGACATKGASTLERVLSTAVREGKVSEEKMETILEEYDSLRKEDRSRARMYVEQIENAVQVGGDSSHIDVVRRMILHTDPKPQV